MRQDGFAGSRCKESVCAELMQLMRGWGCARVSVGEGGEISINQSPNVIKIVQHISNPTFPYMVQIVHLTLPHHAAVCHLPELTGWP